MQMRELGRSGLRVGPLAFGGNVFGWTIDEATSFRLLDRFAEAGLNLVDTADMYSTWVPGHKGGESEAIIGKWLKQNGNRHKVLIATKAGMEMGPTDKGLSRRHLLASIDKSLQRLQTDRVDLYQSHCDDPETPITETMQVFAELIKQGKVRAIGASNFKTERFAEALQVSKEHGLPRYESMQPEYNLYDRAGFEDGLQALCVREGIGTITYWSLASGFLSGKYRSEADLGKSVRGGGIKAKMDARGMRVLQALDDVAAKHHATPSQVALAWLLTRPSVVAPIVSATSVEQFNELIGAATLELDKASLAALDSASSGS